MTVLAEPAPPRDRSQDAPPVAPAAWGARTPLPPLLGFSVYGLLYFSMIAAALAGHAWLGFFNDAAGYVAPATMHVFEHPFDPFPPGNDTGHPLFYTWINGWLWRLLGPSNLVPNVSMWFYGALALLAMHGLTRTVLSRSLGASRPFWAGPLTAVCLYSTPLFIAYCSQYLSGIPNLAFTLLAVWAWAAGRPGWLALWATLLCFTRITGALSVVGFALYSGAWFWIVARPRRWRPFLGRMIPFAVPLGLFGLFLLIKLVVLGRPLSTYGNHNVAAPGWGEFWDRLPHVKSLTFDTPLMSFRLLLVPIALGLTVSAYHALRARVGRPRPVRPSGTDAPGAAAVYLALIALVAPVLLFYLTYPSPDFPLMPRYFLPLHALLVMGAVHGFILLLGAGRSWVVPWMLAWCVMQGVRWKEPWREVVANKNPPRWMRHLSDHRDYTLDLAERKRLYHQAADSIVESGFDPSVIAAWPTTGALANPSSGFSAHRLDCLPVSISGTPEEIFDRLRRAGRLASPVFLVDATWDLPDERPLIQDVLDAVPAFKLAWSFETSFGERLDIYRHQAPEPPA